MNPIGREPASEPGVAVAEQGVVVLDGPQGMAMSMTPDAAEATAVSLAAAARQARIQDAAR